MSIKSLDDAAKIGVWCLSNGDRSYLHAKASFKASAGPVDSNDVSRYLTLRPKALSCRF